MDIAIAHALGGFTGEGGTIAAAAVHNNFGVGVGQGFFDVALEDAAAEMEGLGGVTGGPLVVLADIEEDGAGILREALPGFLEGDFVNGGPGGFDDFEKTGSVLHETRVAPRRRFP